MFMQMLYKYLKVIDDVSETDVEEYCKIAFKDKDIIGSIVFVKDIKEQFLDVVLEKYKKIHKMSFNIDLYRKIKSQVSGDRFSFD